MLVALKPLSQPDKDDIRIEESLFSIGRNEQAFADYDKKTLAYLSKRHARIFIEHEQVYLADLGSRNGTKINDRPIQSRPQPLQSGDCITFANTLRFEVQVERGGANDTHVVNALELLLTPKGSDQGEQAICVRQFPYLVGSSNQEFCAENSCSDAAQRFLSRRHAHFFQQGGQLYLEDLGSTNGTFVNGVRLQETAQVLESGDTLCFGSPHSEFEVTLGDPAAPAVVEDDSVQTYHTAFVSAPDSFLDIFCIEDNEAEEKAEKEPEEQPEAAVAKKPRRRILPKTRQFLQDLREAFGGPAERSAGGKKWLLTVVLLLLAGGLFAQYMLDSDSRLLRLAYDNENYLEALRLADQQLAVSPDDDTHEMARAALIKHFVPLWSSRLLNGDHSAALAQVAQARSASRHLDSSATLLELLEKMTELDRYMRARGGAEAGVDIFDAAAQIEEQLAWWSADTIQHRQTARVILDNSDEFEAVNLQTHSYLRSLENDELVYLPAIAKLRREIVRRLEAGEGKQLEEMFDYYELQYPRLRGMQKLRQDLATYLPLEEAAASGDAPRLARVLADSRFSTPLFERQVKILRDSVPAAETTSLALQEVDTAWRAGELERSISLLDELLGRDGGSDQLQLQLQRKQLILGQYQELQAKRDTSQYAQSLSQFYAQLQPGEDQYLIDKLDPEVLRQSGKPTQSAHQYWARAQDLWQRYRDEGGIGGLLRLEESISAEYKQKTGLLKEAHENVLLAQQFQSTLARPEAEKMLALSRLIEAEIKLQRRSLQQLSIVLGEELLSKKLRLLAEAGTETH